MKKTRWKFLWRFRLLYQRLFYWLEWRMSDERHDPYRCTLCGSKDVEIKVWSKVNEGGRYGGDCEEYDRSYCNECEENVRVRPTSFMLPNAQQWWGESDFQQMERITGYRQDDFSPEDGYQTFVDACDNGGKYYQPKKKYAYGSTINKRKYPHNSQVRQMRLEQQQAGASVGSEE